MIEINWLKLLLCIIGATGVGLLIYHVVAGFYHIRYYIKRQQDPENWKCQPKRFLPDKLARKAIVSGTLNMTLGGTISGIFVYAIMEHNLWTRFYYDVDDYGWAYTIISTLVVWVLIDLMAYYVHRMMHIKWVFKRIHRFHHKFVATTPYAATALHPLELMALQGYLSTTLSSTSLTIQA